ncbi:hypothetical protein pdam_00017071 [Pocillopora damicornis]|uniref:TLDc domain-containing protein n=1 Tax=Pocillopora damicornis TaxID=46731 RepID=A0A3M6UIT1_POCDA|nr:hypothetical protein pdam_00017071 [Pocillopora damicornis]
MVGLEFAVATKVAERVQILSPVMAVNPLTFTVYDAVIADDEWHHVCIARFSRDGSWIFYTDGVKREEGVGLSSNFNTGNGYLKFGMIRGVITGFNMWDQYINSTSQIEKIAHACSSLIGNIVPWPEVYLWRKGNVPKVSTSLCKFQESSHWNFEKSSISNQSYDGLSGKKGTFLTENWDSLKGVASPWYPIAVHFITNIAGFNDEHDAFLGTLLDGAISREGNWYRCFKAFPGWQGQHFHTACDGKGPTVTIIRVRENIFGGFLDKSWGGNDGFINSSKAFIFSLKNLRGLASFKMDIKSDLWTKAAKQRSQSGPIFGETDLVIDSNPTASMESSTDLPNAYQFPSHIDLASDEQDNLLAGRKGFVVDDLETFYYECKIL